MSMDVNADIKKAVEDAQRLPFESYRIILRHEYSDSDGQLHDIEEPLCVSYVVLLGEKYRSEPIMINEMMDKLKQALLKRIGE